MKDIEFLDWSDDSYNGRAVKLGAGVLGYEAVEAAAAEGLVIVSGTCTTVGVVGGYTQGGGHSPLSTVFGLGADQTLQFEVVTASGDVVNASRTENSDLYWALSGGGGGNYGVVLSTTLRAHPDAMISGATLQILASNTTTDKYYQAVSLFHQMLPSMIDSGTTVIYVFTSALFYILPVTGYNQTSAQVQAVVAPFVAGLTNLSVPYTVNYSQFSSYLDHYTAYDGPLPYGHLTVESEQYGGRLIPRSVLEGNNDALQTVLRNLTQNGVQLVGVALNVSGEDNGTNAVLPAWRDATVTMQLTTPWNETAPWSEMVAEGLRMTNEFVPQIEAVTPGSGAYMNEADFRQPNFQDTFYGANYNELLQIKQNWDPNSVFYALKGVGSEFWTVAEDGRMCRNSSSV